LSESVYIIRITWFALQSFLCFVFFPNYKHESLGSMQVASVPFSIVKLTELGNEFLMT